MTRQDKNPRRMLQKRSSLSVPGGAASSFLRLPAQERGHVQVVRRNFLADFAHVLLNLWHDISGLERRLHHFAPGLPGLRSEEHTSELQSRGHLVCRLLLEKKKHSSRTCF